MQREVGLTVRRGAKVGRPTVCGRSASQTVQLAQYCRIATLWRVPRGNGCVQSAIDRASALQRPRCMRGRGMVFDVSQYDREALGDMGEDSPARS